MAEETFGASIRRRRTAAGLSVEDLSQLADVSPSTMRNIEHNRVQAPRVHGRVTEALDRYESANARAKEQSGRNEAAADAGPCLLYVASDGSQHAIDTEVFDPSALSERDRVLCRALLGLASTRLLEIEGGE